MSSCHSFLSVLSQATHSPGSAAPGQGRAASREGEQGNLTCREVCLFSPFSSRSLRGSVVEMRVVCSFSPVGCGISWCSFLVPASCCSASQSNYSILLAPLSGVSLFPLNKTLSSQVEIAETQTVSPTRNLKVTLSKIPDYLDALYKVCIYFSLQRLAMQNHHRMHVTLAQYLSLKCTQ